MLLQELGQRPFLMLDGMLLAEIPGASVYRPWPLIAAGMCYNAQCLELGLGHFCRVRRSWGMRTLLAFDALRSLHLPALLHLLDASALQAQHGLDICSRTHA